MTKFSNLFWGGVLVIIGGLFLMDSLGIFEINLWQVSWPLILILFGVWMLLGHFWRDGNLERQEVTLPLDGMRSAKISIQHGAGRLVVGPGAGPMELATGKFDGGLRYDLRHENDHTKVTMRFQDSAFPFLAVPWIWGPQNQLDWQIQLTDEIPLELTCKTGASDTRLDLTDLQVTNLRVESGASATQIYLPDSVAATKVVFKGGVASVKIYVPENVAARIRLTGGLMSPSVDTNRFPKVGGVYQSQDFESAIHKVELRVEMGLGSVTIR